MKGNFTARIKLLKNVKILFSEIVFGTPGKRCEGSGLCRIYTVTGAKRLRAHSRRIAVILFVNSQGRLGIRLNQEDLPDVLASEVFNRDVFILEEAFALPNYFARKLGILEYFIPAGEYPLVRRGNWLHIVF
ncbi:hypothetical protein Halhy_2117 [Haliscomenobacter hydrossis DSM 1100]|uniref:Uncharacterized protein n=2 Tax=Haliscomenobacter TaxID=2349 RepID=F4KQL3_HALH1|nr:hypothetical protein Halhy_2117 [Haliscomenobacter hydrossis DSM 1100]